MFSALENNSLNVENDQCKHQNKSNHKGRAEGLIFEDHCNSLICKSMFLFQPVQQSIQLCQFWHIHHQTPSFRVPHQQFSDKHQLLRGTLHQHHTPFRRWCILGCFPWQGGTHNILTLSFQVLLVGSLSHSFHLKSNTKSIFDQLPRKDCITKSIIFYRRG